MISVLPGPALALLPLDRHELAACLEAMLRRAAPDLGAPPDLELACLRDADLARLNREYMGCAGPTNILAFPAGEPHRLGSLGSLALSADALRREARLYGQDPAAYCRRLLAHGLAHVLGHDHGPEMNALCARMLDDATLP